MSAEKVLREALGLTSEERQRIRDTTGGSLATDGSRAPEGDGETLTEADWAAVWGPELERRIRDFDEGRAQAIGYEEFKSRMRALFPQ